PQVAPAAGAFAWEKGESKHHGDARLVPRAGGGERAPPRWVGVVGGGGRGGGGAGGGLKGGERAGGGGGGGEGPRARRPPRSGQVGGAEQRVEFPVEEAGLRRIAPGGEQRIVGRVVQPVELARLLGEIVPYEVVPEARLAQRRGRPQRLVDGERHAGRER